MPNIFDQARHVWSTKAMMPTLILLLFITQGKSNCILNHIRFNEELDVT